MRLWLFGIILIFSLFSCRRILRRETIVEPNYKTVQFQSLTKPLSKKYRREKQKVCREFANSIIPEHDFSGMFLVAKENQIITERYSGYAHRKEKKKIAFDTPIHVASISKTITAVMTLKLVDEGLLDLDDLMVQYLPELPYQDVTIRMLLNHRSGIQYYGYFSYHHKRWDFRKPLTNKGIIQILAKYKLEQNFKTNQRFQYSNTNYALLASIIERIKKKPFHKVAEEMIFKPLKMNHSFIFQYPKQVDTVAQSYKEHYKIAPYEYLDGVYGDKNVYTTARDLLKFDQATYDLNFLSLPSRKEMFTGYSLDRRNRRDYGLGWRLVDFETGEKYFFHTGWWHGNTGCYISLRKERVTLICLSNKYSKRPFQLASLIPYFEPMPIDKIW